MKSIQSLFDLTNSKHSSHNIPKSLKKSLSRDCKHIIGYDKRLPQLRYPEANSKEHYEDVEEVKFCYNNPSLDEGFLSLSERSVEDCFNTFCEEMGLNPDWKKIKSIIEDVSTIVLKLKYTYNRPRPKTYLIDESNSYNKILDSESPSFPSGHTCIAYFISGILGDIYPDLRSDLATFLYKSNKKENFNVPFQECLNAASKIYDGYSLEYTTDSVYLKSLIGPLVYSFKIKDIDNPFKIITLHNQMDSQCIKRGQPGEFRSFSHESPAGHQYTDHNKIYNELQYFCSLNKQNPFLRHAYFENIHPFSDGNGRIGRTILCKDLNYDFKKVNKLIGRDYIDKLNLYFDAMK